jgi:hypothetical protein
VSANLLFPAGPLGLRRMGVATAGSRSGRPSTTTDGRGSRSQSVPGAFHLPLSVDAPNSSFSSRPPAISAGFPACGDSRRCPGSCGHRRSLRARDLRGMARSRRSITPMLTTKDADLQDVYGSDGTRTRDLRRDRPLQGARCERRWARDRSVCAVFLGCFGWTPLG